MLRSETKNYVPKFLAITYLMTYHDNYNIFPDTSKIITSDSDTVTLDFQITTKTLSEITCLRDVVTWPSSIPYGE